MNEETGFQSVLGSAESLSILALSVIFATLGDLSPAHAQLGARIETKSRVEDSATMQRSVSPSGTMDSTSSPRCSEPLIYGELGWHKTPRRYMHTLTPRPPNPLQIKTDTTKLFKLQDTVSRLSIGSLAIIPTGPEATQAGMSRFAVSEIDILPDVAATPPLSKSPTSIPGQSQNPVEAEKIDEAPSWVKNEAAKTPLHDDLDQNVPNPFADFTTIRYTLREASTVSLMLYDLMGHEVQKIDGGERSAGQHEIILRRDMLRLGGYCYILATQVGTQQRKIIVLDR